MLCRRRRFVRIFPANQLMLSQLRRRDRLVFDVFKFCTWNVSELTMTVGGCLPARCVSQKAALLC